MSAFLDTANNPVTSLNLAQEQSSAQIFVLKVRARAGFYLTTARPTIGIPQAAPLVLSARFFGTNEPFQNLRISPLDLSRFENQIVAVEFRLETAVVSDITNFSLPVRYTAQP